MWLVRCKSSPRSRTIRCPISRGVLNVGYEEIVSANPGVDPWLPKAGTRVVVPTQFVLPDAPRQGIVINLAAMRLFYFPKAKPGELQRVITHPVGIGRVEWKTPVGVTRVASKKENPAWIPNAFDPQGARQERQSVTGYRTARTG
jgi:lipoprotein-anchoring transpeptidase ErfK/SrfK